VANARETRGDELRDLGPQSLAAAQRVQRHDFMDDAGAWKYKLAGELKLAGYEIDKNKIS